MRRRLLFAALVVVLVIGAGCRAEPPAIAPTDEATATQARPEEKREVQETIPATGTPTPAPPTEDPTMTPAPIPEATGTAPPGEAEAAIRLARQELAQNLDLATEAVLLISVEAVEWPDASLGCPQPGRTYAQVITPGFRVVLEVGGKTYEFHTDRGKVVVLCESASSSGMLPKGIDAAVQDGWPNQPLGNDVVISPPKSQMKRQE